MAHLSNDRSAAPTTRAPGRTGGTGATAADATRAVEVRPDEPSVGQLVASASRDVSTLVRHEIALAKAEVKVSVKNGGVGAALFGAAAFLGALAVIMLSIALAYFIHMTGLDLAWCFSIVFLLYLVLAGILALVGIKKVKKVRPPERAIHQAQETKRALTHRA